MTGGTLSDIVVGGCDVVMTGDAGVGGSLILIRRVAGLTFQTGMLSDEGVKLMSGGDAIRGKWYELWGR